MLSKQTGCINEYAQNCIDLNSPINISVLLDHAFRFSPWNTLSRLNNFFLPLYFQRPQYFGHNEIYSGFVLRPSICVENKYRIVEKL